jgi:hypothetical protein
MAEKIAGCASRLGSTLGCGFLEKVCESALAVVELKAGSTLEPIRGAQCLNYLTAARLRLALLLNFGRPWLEVKGVLSDR